MKQAKLEEVSINKKLRDTSAKSQRGLSQRGFLQHGFRLASLFLLGVASTGAWSMDLVQTYQLAQQQDPDWQATFDQYLADQQQQKLVRGALLPVVGLSASIKRNRFDPDEPQNNQFMGQSISASSSTTKQAGVSLRQPLFRMDLWQQYNQAKVANNLNDSRYLSSQQTFTLKVAEAYFDVLRAQSLIKTLDAEEKALQRQMIMMQARLKEGVVARTDVSETVAQYQNAVANRIAGENQIINAQENLTVILGQSIPPLAPLANDFDAAPPVPNEVESWVALAREKSPQLAQARFQYQIAEENRKIQQSGYYPQLDLVAQTGWNKQTPTTLFNNNGQNSTVGLELNLPLYRGGRTKTAVTQAAYQASAARNQVDLAERQVSAAVRSAFINLNTDRARIKARKNAMQSSDLVAQASQASYDLGLRTIVDVLLAQRNAFAAQQDYMNARYDYVINVLRLKQAAGQLDEQALAEINQWLVES